MAARPHRVAIVGGGIGGLFAAHAMLARGLDVAVYEQASKLGEVGAGVFITPNAVRQMRRVGLGLAVERFGALVGSASRYRRHDGAEIAPVRVTDAEGWAACYGMHRADLIDLLAEPLPTDVVCCGRQAIGYEEAGERARIMFADGGVAEADAVVACDGIHSALRPHVHPPSRPVFHGAISYRGLIAADRLPDWPMDRWEMWSGPNKHFLVFPVRHGEMINYVGFTPTDAEMRESWSAPGDPDVLRREFEGWDPRIGEALAAVEDCFRWALYDREPLPRWSQGRLTLLGDAAHPMLPHLGQGANQAIEDGMALATILSAAPKAAIPQALQAYERLRRGRVADIQAGARRNGLRVDSLAAYADLEKRDRELAAHADFRARLYAYDVLPAAEAAAAELRSA